MAHAPTRSECHESRFPCGLLPFAAVLLSIGLFLLLGQGRAGATEVPGRPVLLAAAPGDPLPGNEPDQPNQPQPQPQQPSSTAPTPPPSTPTTASTTPAQPRNEPRATGLGRDDDEDTGPLALLIALVGTIGGLVVGLVIGALIGRGKRSTTSPAATTASAVATTAPVAQQRELLVLAAIDSRDQVTSQALADKLGRALWEAGITEIRADGQRFDPRLHQAVDQVATADPNLDGVIAATERPGYADAGRVIRLPQVVVHRVQR